MRKVLILKNLKDSEIPQLQPNNIFYDEAISYDRFNHDSESALNLKSGECYMIFVPVIQNFRYAYSYDGVINAIYVYLELINRNLLDSSVVLLSSESKESFFMHCDYASFLKCPNVYFVQNNLQSINSFLDSFQILAFDREDAISCLKKIHIKIPDGNSTNHGVINEWSRERWSKVLGLPDEQNESNATTSLYYKYIKTVFPVKEPLSSELNKFNYKGKVLLIDDEEDKGWSSFFEKLFENTGIEFDSIGSLFSKYDECQIIDSAKEKIKFFNPDLIILDLRLHGNDANKANPSDLTGIKILKAIKSSKDDKDIDSGIQVIGFTASNKVWNYKEMLKSKVNSIIVKESPQMSGLPGYSRKSVNDLINTINNLLARAPFLKEITRKCEELLQTLKNNSNLYSKLFIEDAKSKVQLALKVLNSTDYSNQNAYRKIAYLLIFQIVEDFVLEESVLYCGDTVVKVIKPKSKIEVAIKKNKEWNVKIYYDKVAKIYKTCNGTTDFIRDTNFKMSALLIYRYGFQDSSAWNWGIVRDVRNNKVAHVDRDIITDNEFKYLIDFVINIVDSKNIK